MIYQDLRWRIILYFSNNMKNIQYHILTFNGDNNELLLKKVVVVFFF